MTQDELDACVATLRAEGMKGADITRALGITRGRYNAAALRLDRAHELRIALAAAELDTRPWGPLSVFCPKCQSRHDLSCTVGRVPHEERRNAARAYPRGQHVLASPLSERAKWALWWAGYVWQGQVQSAPDWKLHSDAKLGPVQLRRVREWK